MIGSPERLQNRRLSLAALQFKFLATRATLAWICRELWRAALCLFRLPAANTAIRGWPGNCLCNRNAWLYGVEHIRIRLFLHEVECLLANSRPLAAHKDMAIIILNLTPRAFVNHGLVLLEALTLLCLLYTSPSPRD